MSIPTPPGQRSEGDDLVEPEKPAPSFDPLEFDTERILHDTSSLPVIEDEVEQDTAVGSANPPSSENGEVPQKNPEALESPAGLNILSIVSLVLALTLSPFAVLFGYLSIGQIRRSRQRGQACAWVAIGLGWLWLVAYTVAGIVLAMTWLQVM